MQYYKSGYKAALQPVRKYPDIHHGKICRLTARALCALFAALFLFASCGENNKESTDKDTSLTHPGDSLSLLLVRYLSYF